MSVPRWFQTILHHYHVPYEGHHHPPVFDAARLAEAEHTPGHRVAKTVFLTATGRPVAIVLPANARLDLERVRAVLGVDDLRLATEPEMAAWFKGCPPGAVPPLRLRADECILMDRSLAHLGNLLIPAGTHEDAAVLRFRDWYRMVRPGVGRFTVATREQAANNGKPHVMVVEDEPTTNQLLCRLLEKQGITSHGVEGGMEALTVAAAVQPCAILLDLMLSDMSGFEVYERLRRSGPRKTPSVIVVTALDDEATRRRGSELGADAYLTKPFRADALLQELQAVLADASA